MQFTFGDDRDWFLSRRFGLFTTWGVHAIDGWHEQMQYRRGMSRAEYRPLMNRFDPVRFSASAWLDFIETHGLEYLCFVTKHIDGFCLWDTQQTDFKVTNSPFGRDVFAELAAECHRRNVPLMPYFSTIDNDHPAYPHRGGAYEKAEPEPGETADIDNYLAFVRAQVEELCTEYGKIGGFWWDCGGIRRVGVHDESFNARIRELQPGAVINNRGFSVGDFTTPERDWAHAESSRLIDADGAFTGPVEACQSIGSESWGFRLDEDYYTPRHIQASMFRIFGRGGNYLLNVGPAPDGTFPEAAHRIFGAISSWRRSISESLDGTRYLTRRVSEDFMFTDRDIEVVGKDSTLYVALTGTPLGDRLLLKPIRKSPIRATLLNDGRPIRTSIENIPSEWRDGGEGLRLVGLPVEEFANEVPVIRLDFDVPIIGESMLPDSAPEKGQP